MLNFNTSKVQHSCNEKNSKKQLNLYSTLYISSLSLKHSDMARVWQGDHTVLPATHTRTIPAFTPQPQSITPFGWYSLCLPMKGWPGWVDLGGWLHKEMNGSHWELNPDTVTHLSTNRARRWLTSLIKANTLTTTPDHHLHPQRWNAMKGSETQSPSWKHVID